MTEEAIWDDAVAASPYPHLLQTYRWGELQARFGWELRREMLAVNGGRAPVSLQLSSTLVPGQRFGYVPKGPGVAREQLPALLAQLGELAKAEGLAFLRVEPELEGELIPPPGWTPAAPTQPPQTSIVDITPDPDRLLAGFKPKTRYNVRLAERKGVEVETSADIATFATLSRETSARHQVHLADEPYLRELHSLLAPAGRCLIYLARHQGRALAGIVVVRFAGRSTYLFGASSAEGRELMPAYLLHWRAMLDARQSGDREYDLWGVPPDGDRSHPWAGLRQFKSGWNGRMVRYAGAFELVLRPAAARAHQALNRIRGTVRRARSRAQG